jgi:hypothetical protein
MTHSKATETLLELPPRSAGRTAERDYLRHRVEQVPPPTPTASYTPL